MCKNMKSFSQSQIFLSLFFALLCTLFSLDVHAQSDKVTISRRHVTVKTVLNDIESQTHYLFIYGQEVNVSRKVTVNVKNQPVSKVLHQLFSGQSVKYSTKGDHIVLSVVSAKSSLEVGQGTRAGSSSGKIVKASGLVLDAEGEPIIGATIKRPGASTGTITDVDGHFTIDVPEGSTLQISYIGYEDREVRASANMNITLKSNVENLNEVVVVGYGTQKKVDLTGAVSSVKMDDVLGNRPISSVSEALQGAIPGLQVTSTSGIPGKGMSFNIRGVNSINTGSPLVLVDNVEMDVNMLDPNDIESVTVLKDAASSAIYGARAAFGVILITTKKGNKESAFHLNYSNNFAFSDATNIPKKATPLQTVQAYKDQGVISCSTGQDVDTWLELLKDYQNNPNAYPNGYVDVNGLRYSLAETDLFADMMETGFKQSHNVSASGGGKHISYRIGIGYVNQDGILYSDKDSFKRSNVSSFINADITSWLNAQLDVKYARSKSSMPYTTASYGIWGAAVAFPSYFPTGEMELGGETLPINTPRNFIRLASTNSNVKNDTRIFGKITLTPIKDFHIIGEYTFNYKTLETSTFDKKFEYIHGAQFRKEQSVSNSKFEHSQGNTDYNALNIYANYNKSFRNHNFGVTAGFNQESNNYSYNMAYRTDMINEELPSLSQATGAYYTTDSYSRYTVRGLFYRITYDYQGKYLFETNGRYDGSSKFPSKKRFGFFPSISAGWRVSEEKFMEWSKVALSNLKLRISWGNIGNQSISAYAYIPGMSSYQANWVVDGLTQTTLSSPKLVSNSFTWEKVSTLDFGVDLGFFKNCLNIVFDWYNRKTKGMLAPGMELPSVLGADAPLQNAANLGSKGWELSLSWDDHVGEVGYHFGFNIYDSKTKITKYNNETGLIGNGIYRKGMYLGEIWGYETDRLYAVDDFNDDGSLKDGIAKVEGYNPNPGDILYVDQDGNGIINKGILTTSNPGDRKIIGNNTRRYQFGVNGGVDWRGISFSFILQGVGKRDLWLMNELTYPIYDRWSTLYSNQLDYWTKTNTDSFFPRIYENSEGNTVANTQVQTRYLKNGAYLSVKNITLSYMFPHSLINKLGVNKLSIFFSGENLFTFDHLPKGVDAERVVTDDLGARGFSYPYMRQFSFGINLTL